MTLFDLAIFIVKLLIGFIIIFGILLVMATIWATVDFIKFKIKNKKAFDKAWPVGSHYLTHLKQKFPYGKWKLLGQNQHGFYLYERTK